MRIKYLFSTLVIPTLLLAVPLVAMQFTREVAWNLFDFIAAWALLAGAGSIFVLATTRAINPLYRIATAFALGTTLLEVWALLAVGLIGNETNPINSLYAGVLVTGLVGTAFAKLRAEGMSQTLFAMALVQFIVPLAALAVWHPIDALEVIHVLGGNLAFVALFITSGYLFHLAAQTKSTDLLHQLS